MIKHIFIISLILISKTLFADDLCLKEPSQFAGMIPEIIIGENDLKTVNNGDDIKYPGLSDKIDAIGRMMMKKDGYAGLCTVTHIGNGYAVTAGHCLIDDSSDKKMELESCDHVSVSWGYYMDNIKSKKIKKSQCKEIIVAELNSKRDYAIIRIHPIPKVKIDIQEDVSNTTDLTILSHPQGRPLEDPGVCAMDENLEYGSFKTDKFTYQCDTQGGSSGAAVIDVKTGKIVGLHNAGVDKDRANLPKSFNLGTHISKTPIPAVANDIANEPSNEDDDDIDSDKKLNDDIDTNKPRKNILKNLLQGVRRLFSKK